MLRSVENVYRKMLEKIDGFYRKEAAWYLEMALWAAQDDHPTFINIDDYCIAKYGLEKDLHLSRGLTADNIASLCSDVHDRIKTTCGGLLNIVTCQQDGVIGEWLGWQPRGETGYDMSRNWHNIGVQFCHRTAKEFLDTNEKGRQFLRKYHTFFEDSTLLRSAIGLARMNLCRLNDQDEVDEYMYNCAETIFWGFDSIGDRVNPDLRPAVALMDYFDEQMQTLYWNFGLKHRYDHWCRHLWTKPSSDEFRVNRPVLGYSEDEDLTFPVECEPNDLLSFCDITRNYWYVQAALGSMCLSPSKASQLAWCVTAYLRDREENYHLWDVWRWDQVNLLKNFMNSGADPSTGALTSIWSEVLRFMYDSKFDFHPGEIVKSKRDDDCYTAVVDAFLKAGANPKQRVTWTTPNDYMDVLVQVCFEIDFDHLPLLGQNEEAEYRESADPSSCGTSVIGTPRAAPRIRFEGAHQPKSRQWTKPSRRGDREKCDLWGEEGVCMSNKEVQKLNGILREALDTPASKDHYPIRPLAECLKATFMDECNLCQRILSIPLDGFREVQKDSEKFKRILVIGKELRIR